MTDHGSRGHHEGRRKPEMQSDTERVSPASAGPYGAADIDGFEQGMLGPQDFVGDERYTPDSGRADRAGDARTAPREHRVRSDVGYGRPPSEYRFQKGVSGNPRGRRPARVPYGLGQALVECGKKVEKVRRGNDVVELTREEILAESLWTESINGKVKDKVKLVELLQRCGVYRVEDEVDRICQAEEDRLAEDAWTDEYDREVQRLLDEIDSMPDEYADFHEAADKCTCAAFQAYKANFPKDADDPDAARDAAASR